MAGSSPKAASKAASKAAAKGPHAAASFASPVGGPAIAQGSSPMSPMSPVSPVSPMYPVGSLPMSLTGSPRGTGISSDEHKLWEQCVKNVRDQLDLDGCTSKVAITMGGTHGQIDTRRDRLAHDIRKKDTHLIPLFVDIPRKHKMFQILAAPFTVPHYGDDSDFIKQLIASKPEMEAFLRAPTPDNVMAIADKMKMSDDVLAQFLSITKPLTKDFDDSDGKVRHVLEKVAFKKSIPISYTSYQNANVASADVCAYTPWNIGASHKSGSAAHCSAVPLLNKTYLLTGEEYREGLKRQNEWKFILYYLGKDQTIKQLNILKFLIDKAPFVRFPEWVDVKGYDLRPIGNHMFITTENIVKLIYAAGFKTQLHVDVTCNVIRDGHGGGVSEEQERMMRRDLNLLYIPRQLAIQAGRVSVSGLDAMLRSLTDVPIAEGGGGVGRCRRRRSSHGHDRRRQTRRFVRHNGRRQPTRKIRTRRRH